MCYVHKMSLLCLILIVLSLPAESPERASSVLVQLLAILRNLSDSGNSRDNLLTTDSLLDHLCSVLLYHCHDPDVAFNLCRLLRYVVLCKYIYKLVCPDVVLHEQFIH